MVRQSAWTRFVWISLIVVVLIALASVTAAQESVTVQLDPLGESGVTGTATLTAAGEGTDVALDVQGLAAGAEAQAAMQAGTCDVPGASFAALPSLTADETGATTATGSVLFRGTEDVALATMADGEHVIAIQAGGQVVACGVIPALSSDSPAPILPETGGAGFAVAAAGAGVLGLSALFAGLSLFRGRRSGGAATQP